MRHEVESRNVQFTGRSNGGKTQKGMIGKKTFVVALFDVRNAKVVAFRILIER